MSKLSSFCKGCRESRKMTWALSSSYVTQIDGNCVKYLMATISVKFFIKFSLTFLMKWTLYWKGLHFTPTENRPKKDSAEDPQNTHVDVKCTIVLFCKSDGWRKTELLIDSFISYTPWWHGCIIYSATTFLNGVGGSNSVRQWVEKERWKKRIEEFLMIPNHLLLSPVLFS